MNTNNTYSQHNEDSDTPTRSNRIARGKSSTRGRALTLERRAIRAFKYAPTANGN